MHQKYQDVNGASALATLPVTKPIKTLITHGEERPLPSKIEAAPRRTLVSSTHPTWPSSTSPQHLSIRVLVSSSLLTPHEW